MGLRDLAEAILSDLAGDTNSTTAPRAAEAPVGSVTPRPVPVSAPVVVGAARTPAGEGTCYQCRGRRFWRSVQAARSLHAEERARLICARCHAPTFPGLVAAWVDLPEPVQAIPEHEGINRHDAQKEEGR